MRWSHGTTHNHLLPDIPTMTELGFPGMTPNSVLALFGPSHLPPAIAQTLFESASDSMCSEAVTAGLTKMGYTLELRTPQEFSHLCRSISSFGS